MLHEKQVETYIKKINEEKKMLPAEKMAAKCLNSEKK